MFVRFIVGIILVAAAVLFIVKTEWFINAFGRIAWAEEKLGIEGGTRLFYKLLGFALIILAFLIMSGKIFGILDSVFNRGNSTTVQQ